MSDLRVITEYLGIDMTSEEWVCRSCGARLGSARTSYKFGLLLRERDPREIHSSGNEGHGMYPDRDWCRVVEMFCPGCGTLVEVEYLPPGHPITHDIELDIDALKAEASSDHDH